MLATRSGPVADAQGSLESQQDASRRSRSGLTDDALGSLLGLAPELVRLDEAAADAAPDDDRIGLSREDVLRGVSDGSVVVERPLRSANRPPVPPALLKRAKISLGVVPTGHNGRTKWKLPTEGEAENLDWLLGKPFDPEDASYDDHESPEDSTPAANGDDSSNVERPVSPTSEEVQKELQQAVRDVRRRIVRSKQWSQMAAAGQIPERLSAVAESERDDGD